MKKITLLIAFMLSLVTMGYGQTVLVNPAAEGGFANGTTFAANGWTVSNSANNPWVVGTAAASGALTGNAAYISNSGAFAYNADVYAGNYFYRDVTVPAGETKITLTFNWYGQGESTWDLWQVFAAPTTVTPVGTTTYPGSGLTNVPAEIAGATFVGSNNLLGTVQTATYTLSPSLAGTTFRLIFYWKNDNGTGTQPPAAIDNISLTSSLALNYVSVATGNFGDASTWNLNSVPTLGDNITIAAGHTVTVNATGQSANNVIVNGTLAYGTSPTTFAVNGNLTVNAGGAVNVLNDTTGKTLSVFGNIVNNGSINLSVGTTTAGNLTLNGTGVQTLSGTGTFVNNMIRNLTFSNTSTAIPNINWQMNNISVEYNLNITNAKINLGTNTFTYGSSATLTGNTFTVTNGGFMPGGKFVRWWSASGTGYVTSGPTSVATGEAGRYPFILSNGQQRLFYLGRTTPTAGGKFSVVFNNATTFTSGLSIADGSYTVTDRWNGNFVVSTEGTSPAAASYWTTIFAPDLYYPASGNSRVMGQSAAISGTHVNTSTFAAAQRSGVSLADVTAATGLYMGIAYADISHTAIANGDWSNPAIWNKGVVPACTDVVMIPTGTTVTVNTAGALSKNLTIASGATLNITSGDLTVGCTLKNNVFTNNGTLTVSGGTLNVNGNMLHASGSTFNQSGGDINVDGNDGGATATSVASATAIVQINTNLINWSGGTLTIVDPHAATGGMYVFQYNNAANVNITSGSHILRFGNGVSTDAGGSSTYGFRYYIFQGSGRLSFNNIVVNGGAGTNRFVTNQGSHGINGDLTINANGEYRDNANTVYLAKNLNNNGTYVSTGILYAGTFIDGTGGVSANAQTISGTGVFINNATPASATANFNSVTVNNSNSAGVTFKGNSNISTQPSNSASVSGTLTFIAGKAATSGGASFILGNSTPSAGTLTYTAGGFVSGTTFGRWFTATGTGTSITAAADATGTGGRYPFVNSANFDRSASIERNTPAAAAGVLAVTYTAGAGTTSVNVTDGAATVDLKGNDAWAVSVLSGTPTAAASFEIQLLAPGLFTAPLQAANARIMAGAGFAGTHQGGTVTPGGQRVLSAAELVNAPFSLAISSTDVPYVSVASGNWNSPTTWQSGVVPSCNDVVNIVAGHTVTVNAAGAVSKNIIVATGATLTIASGDLTVGCTSNNNTLTINGTLNVNGGALNVNGNINAAASSVFNQTGGTIKIDGNAAGVVANSVASGTALFALSTTNVNLTGGTLLFVDPHVATSAASGYAISFSNSTGSTATSTSLLTSPAHITQFGDGVSTDAGGHVSGFYINNWATSAYLSFGSVVVNGGTGTNRNVVSQYQLTANGNFTVNASGSFSIASLIVGGNIVVNTGGTLINTSGVVTGVTTSSSSSSLTFGPATAAQTFTNNGVIAELATGAVTNFIALTINNTNAAGVTFASPFRVSGTLTLTAGKVNSTAANLLSVGTATAVGTITGGSATAYINGPLERTIASGNTNTSYITFPVGKAAYAPVFVAPLTTAVTVMKAEAFDTNAGTADPSIINLANRRWEVPVVSGTVTNLNVRLGDANITATKIPVMAPAAAGVYTASFGSAATYAAGTPNTTQSNNNITSANYTGFLSFADSNACSGTPAPGNTIASVNNICQGTSVTFTVQNTTAGTGVTYQWQSSANGTTWADITGATTATLTTAPAAPLYYRLNVTCATGPSTGSSTPVQITFSSTSPTTTGATRCGAGSVTVNAVPASGGFIEWFDAASGGTYKGTGNALTTDVTSSTNLYASSSTPVAGSVTVGTGTTTTGATDVLTAFNNRFTGYRMQIIYTAAELKAAGLLAGNITSIAFNTTTPGDGTTNNDFTVKLGAIAGNAFPSTTYVTTGLNTVYGPVTHTHTSSGWQVINFTAPYNWDGTSNIIVDVAMLGANATNNAITYYTPTTGVNSIMYSTGFASTTGTLSANRLNIQFGGQSACRSARTAAAVTITAPPALTLSGNPAAICSGQSTAAVNITAGATDYNTFTWTPSTGVSGNAATGWIFNPTVSTQYTLTASQTGGSLCNAVPVNINVTVNALPSSTITVPATLSVCAQSTQPITIANAIGAQTVTVGTGTTAPGNTSYPNPLSAYYGGAKTQILFTADELMALGLTPGTTISNLSFDLFASVAGPLNDLRIKMGTTTNQNTTGGFVASTGLTTVYNQSFTPVAGTTGLIAFTLTTPYTWNGGNLIIEVAHNAGNTGGGSGTRTRTTQTTFNSVYTGAKDSVTPAGVTSYDALTAYDVASASDLRPNVVFGYTSTNTVVWTPATNLFTDAAATIPYTNQNIATVYTKPTANITYTATVTNTASCQLARQVVVTYVNTPAPTVAASTQNICNAGTVADLVATGTAIKWYAAATGGTALATTTALVNGTTYYASQTANACESLTRVALTVNITVISAPTVPAATQDFCNTATVADLVAVGSGIKWYAAATGGTALVTTTALVNGTQYFASQTVNGCESIVRTGRTANITAPAAPTVATATPVFCNTATVADLVATGSNIKWYAAATGGTELVATTALVSGTAYYASQTINGCEGLQRATVTPTINVTPTPTVDAATQTFCNAATVADLVANGTDIKWYAAATGGTPLLSTDVLVNGTAYYASQTLNACESTARVQRTAVINVVAAPTVDAATQTFCNAGTVAELTVTGADVKWYDAETAGNLLDGTTALVNGNVYYASQTIDGCEGLTRVAKTAVINVVVAPTVDAEQEFCDAALVADLIATGSDVKWYDAETAGNLLTDETELADGSVYYASQTIEGCEGLSRAAVTVVIHNVVVDTPADVAVCTEYVLPALTNGAYYTEPNGAGTEIAAGTAVTATTTFYVYAQEGTDVVCSDESSFTVTVANIPAPTGEATQVVTVSDASQATIEDLVVVAIEGGTITWYATAEDAAAGTNPLAAGTVVTNGSTYYAVQTVGECTSPALAVTAEVVLGREGFDPKAFSYYPNPVKDVLNISYSSDITSVTVFNLLGQQVMTLAPNATDIKIDMSSLADAPYVVNVTAGNTVKTIKVIKKQ